MCGLWFLHLFWFFLFLQFRHASKCRVACHCGFDLFSLVTIILNISMCSLAVCLTSWRHGCSDPLLILKLDSCPFIIDLKNLLYQYFLNFLMSFYFLDSVICSAKLSNCDVIQCAIFCCVLFFLLPLMWLLAPGLFPDIWFFWMFLRGNCTSQCYSGSRTLVITLWSASPFTEFLRSLT